MDFTDWKVSQALINSHQQLLVTGDGFRLKVWFCILLKPVVGKLGKFYIAAYKTARADLFFKECSQPLGLFLCFSLCPSFRRLPGFGFLNLLAIRIIAVINTELIGLASLFNSINLC